MCLTILWDWCLKAERLNKSKTFIRIRGKKGASKYLCNVKFSYPNMNLRRQRTLCREIYKTLNKFNPGYTNDIFKLRNTDRLTREKSKLNFEIPKPNQITFGTRSLSYGPETWNALP